MSNQQQTTTRKVVAIGETIMDILFKNRQPVAAVAGGSSFNSMVSIGRSGLPCSFVGYTGEDFVGRQIVEFMEANGIGTEFFEVRSGEKSAISLAYLDDAGDANYVFYKSTPSVRPGWKVPSFGRDDVMLYGSYYAVCDGMREQVEEVQRRAVEANSIIYYDLNFRRSHQHELEHLLPNIHANFRVSTIVRGSADDFEVMYGTRDARTIYERHIREYCPLFICTAGGGEIAICTPTATHTFAAPRIADVVSTVGAGDNFNAGFICALLRYGVTRDMLPTLTREGWQQLVDMGCRYAGAVCRSTDNYVPVGFEVD